MECEAVYKISIEYGAVLNRREGCGWLPMVWVNGRRECCHEWAATGYDRDVAHARAAEMAAERRERYSGDWEITVCAREGAD